MAGEGVGQMGEPCVPCSDPSGKIQGFVKTEVRVVFLVTYSVESKVFQPFQLFEFPFRNLNPRTGRVSCKPLIGMMVVPSETS